MACHAQAVDYAPHFTPTPSAHILGPKAFPITYSINLGNLLTVSPIPWLLPHPRCYAYADQRQIGPRQGLPCFLLSLRPYLPHTLPSVETHLSGW